MSRRFFWIGWLAMTVGVGTWFAFALPTKQSSSRSSAVFLPGATTHGHYQIELKCSVCHDPGGGVIEKSCTDCHGQELSDAQDTHPKKKFRDPTKAHLLQRVNAQNCITCHEEHVPGRTHAMGLTLPEDYCFHCHQSIAKDRPSHERFTFDSCATAGCHNYHDNTAIYENFLFKHDGEPDLLASPRALLRKRDQPVVSGTDKESKRLTVAQHDAPREAATNAKHLADWAETAHARAGVNCSGCHQPKSDDGKARAAWSNEVTHENCRRCHRDEVDGFLHGLHGMRLAQGLSPMTPEQARQPMKHDSLHRSLNCNACHPAHRYDTGYAAVTACVSCHDDDHSRNYLDSKHHRLWQAEQNGTAPRGSGVSCATCHLPRIDRDQDGDVRVMHNQNWNLQPNEKMVRSACLNCHGLPFSLDALADPKLKTSCYEGRPLRHVPSIDMARTWFAEKERQRQQRTQNSATTEDSRTD